MFQEPNATVAKESIVERPKTDLSEPLAVSDIPEAQVEINFSTEKRSDVGINPYVQKHLERIDLNIFPQGNKLQELCVQVPSLIRYDLKKVVPFLNSFLGEFDFTVLAKTLHHLTDLRQFERTNTFYDLHKDTLSRFRSTVSRFTISDMQTMISKVLQDEVLFKKLVFELHPNLKPREAEEDEDNSPLNRLRRAGSNTETVAISTTLKPRRRLGLFGEKPQKNALTFLNEQGGGEITGSETFAVSAFSEKILEKIFITKISRIGAMFSGDRESSFNIQSLKLFVDKIESFDLPKREVASLFFQESRDFSDARDLVTGISKLEDVDIQKILQYQEIIQVGIGIVDLSGVFRNIAQNDAVKTESFAEESGLISLYENLELLQQAVSQSNYSSISEISKAFDEFEVKMPDLEGLLQIFDEGILTKESLELFIFITRFFASDSFNQKYSARQEKTTIEITGVQSLFLKQQMIDQNISWSDLAANISIEDLIKNEDMVRRLASVFHIWFSRDSHDSSVLFTQILFSKIDTSKVVFGMVSEKLEEFIQFLEHLSEDKDAPFFAQIFSHSFRDIDANGLLDLSDVETSDQFDISTPDEVSRKFETIGLIKQLYEDESKKFLITHFVKKAQEIGGTSTYFNFKISEWPYVLEVLNSPQEIDAYLSITLLSKTDLENRIEDEVKSYDFASSISVRSVENYAFFKKNPESCLEIKNILHGIAEKYGISDPIFSSDELISQFIADNYKSYYGHSLNGVFRNLHDIEYRNIFMRFLNDRKGVERIDLAAVSHEISMVTNFVKEITGKEIEFDKVTDDEFFIYYDLVVYSKKFLNSLGHMEIIHQIVNAVVKGEYKKWKYGDIDVLKTKQILPESLTPEMYIDWQENASVKTTERLQGEAETARTMLKLLFSDNMQSLFTDYEHVLAKTSEMLKGTALEQYLRTDLIDLTQENFEQVLKFVGMKMGEASSLLKKARAEAADVSELESSFSDLKEVRTFLQTVDRIRALAYANDELLIKGSDDKNNVKTLFSQLRSAPGMNEVVRSAVLQNAESLLQESLGTSTSREQDYTIEFTDDLRTTLEIGERPVMSCQNFRDGIYNQGLLGFTDPDHKLIIVKDEAGKIIARRIIRLLESSINGQVKLQVERLYSTSSSSRLDVLTTEMAKQIAQKMGVEIQNNRLESRASRAPNVYVDSAGGINMGTFSI